MPQERTPLTYRVADTVSGGVDLLLITPLSSWRGHVWYVDAIGVCNRDGAAGLVDVGIHDGHREIPFETVTLGLAGVRHLSGLQLTLLTDYAVYARFRYDAAGGAPPCDDGDRCELAVQGYLLEPQVLA